MEPKQMKLQKKRTAVKAVAIEEQTQEQKASDMSCSLDNPEACEACGS